MFISDWMDGMDLLENGKNKNEELIIEDDVMDEVPFKYEPERLSNGLRSMFDPTEIIMERGKGLTNEMTDDEVMENYVAPICLNDVIKANGNEKPKPLFFDKKLYDDEMKKLPVYFSVQNELGDMEDVIVYYQDPNPTDPRVMETYEKYKDGLRAKPNTKTDYYNPSVISKEEQQKLDDLHAEIRKKPSDVKVVRTVENSTWIFAPQALVKVFPELFKDENLHKMGTEYHYHGPDMKKYKTKLDCWNVILYNLYKKYQIILPYPEWYDWVTDCLICKVCRKRNKHCSCPCETCGLSRSYRKKKHCVCNKKF